MNERQQFESLLDALPAHKSDAILVLSNSDEQENSERVSMGVELLFSGLAPVMLLFNDSNTKAEAYRITNLIGEIDWASVLLVTHQYHSYRAYLTFLAAFRRAGFDINLSIKSLPSLPRVMERSKIEQYSGVGDCLTYNEGIEYLNAHNLRS